MLLFFIIFFYFDFKSKVKNFAFKPDYGPDFRSNLRPDFNTLDLLFYNITFSALIFIIKFLRFFKT